MGVGIKISGLWIQCHTETNDPIVQSTHISSALLPNNFRYVVLENELTSMQMWNRWVWNYETTLMLFPPLKCIVNWL